MGGKSSTISSSTPALGALQVQTSMAGLAIPLVWGRTRLPVNLLWYGNFKAIAHTETTQSGGKGGGGVTQTDTKYTYQAALIMALCGTQLNGIPSAWRGKQRYSGESLSGKTTTLKQTVTVPGGGVVTVTLPGAATFTASVAVRDPAYGSPGYEIP